MATNMFITFDDPVCAGGSTSKGHEGECEVLSWSHAFDQPTSPVRSHAGGGTIEKANHQDFVFVKSLDSATDDLLKQLWSGKHIGKVTFACYRSQGDVAAVQNATCYLMIEMESVIVSSFSTSGSEGQFPVETISLAYGKVTYTYTGHDRTKGTTGSAQPVFHDLRDHTVG